ncbi:DUF2255 family protein (plasmid) [Chryseobacterium panacisoli]|uniref:DUF2255 family protein n=1 Tax=Chryseobacterium panacisoli TaxID=1807141 RepID=A0A5D8ZVU6_9FLAO|nr:DUF2255 family protein [Chryseobacterium panacisoli]TZF98476.1 DUF2255 family protein [Chryseobacterium panacisoli]
MNKENALHYIKTNTIIGIKAGFQRSDFLEIWMIVVQDRIFARSWGLAEKSWYNTFLENPEGEIQCGKIIYPIKAAIPEDLNDITEEINQAYLAKYNTGHNIPYSRGIIQEKHVAKTMEFVILD